jgi:hypothetical protein
MWSLEDSRQRRLAWSHSLSGWPSFTDSEVKRKVSPSAGIFPVVERGGISAGRMKAAGPPFLRVTADRAR